LLGTVAAAVSAMSFVVIPREERYLECRFGAEYLGYKAKAGRWL
jgi:protein-S-isoprenylcysteine O-methyltransferase Ste14